MITTGVAVAVSWAVNSRQGCAQRTAAGGRRALTRAERRGRSPLVVTHRHRIRLLTYLRPLGWSVSLRAIMEIRTRGANRCSTALKASGVIGVSPRRSDRCAIVQLSSVQSYWGDDGIDVVGSGVVALR
jgi:hypothetical protein